MLPYGNAGLVDIETKILNERDERMHGLTQMGVVRPELIRVVNNVQRDLSFVYECKILISRCAKFDIGE